MINNIKTWTNENSELVEKYAEFVMDSMDMKTMEQFVFDTLINSFGEYTEEELINEICECYGEEWFADHDMDLIENVEE